MNDQMIRVISSPSSSTTGFSHLDLGHVSVLGVWQCCRTGVLIAARRGGPVLSAARAGILTVIWPPSRNPAREGARRGRRTTVANQPPPLEGVDVFSSNLPLVEATEREGAGWVRERAAALGRVVGRRAAAALGAAGEREQAGAAHARPLRQPHRRGRVPPRLAQADEARRRARAALAAVDERRALAAHRARGAVHDRDAGRGGLLLPDHDDLRGRARAARPARAGGRVGAARDRDHLRPALSRPPRRARRSRAWR